MKIAVFAHYDKNNQIKSYVLYYLQALRQVCDEIIFITTSCLSDIELSKVSLLCSNVISRENIGHDFYSYKVGINTISDLSKVEQLILCNDSCYGPIFDLKPMFQQMNVSNDDFWGISALSRPQLHLQSYFLVFNHKVIQSTIFKKFWSQVKVLNNKDKIIIGYEVGLSQCLINAKFSWQTIIPHTDYKLSYWKIVSRKIQIYWHERAFPNSRYSWKTLGEPLVRIDKTLSLYDYSLHYYQLPFIKKSLFLDNWQTKAQIIEVVRHNTNYPVSLFEEI